MSMITDEQCAIRSSKSLYYLVQLSFYFLSIYSHQWKKYLQIHVDVPCKHPIAALQWFSGQEQIDWQNSPYNGYSQGFLHSVPPKPIGQAKNKHEILDTVLQIVLSGIWVIGGI